MMIFIKAFCFSFLQSCIAGLNPSRAVSPVPSIALMLLVFAGLVVLPLEARADRTINSVTLDGAAGVSVPLGASISAVVNVTTTSNPSDAKWRSTGWSIGTTAPGAVTCVDHANVNNAGTYSQTIGITAPATAGVYNAYFIAYNDDTCSSGASTPTFTMANAVTVTNNPVPSTSSISPVSKNIGAASFVLTVNGGNFVNGAVVNFAGAPRTTTFVSATQLTASIPAGDLTTLGTFNITVFNPAPGGGTSNAQAFTVTPLPPSATTNAATGVTSWVATVNGTVSSNGGSSTVSFEYGLTNAYGYSIAATQSPLAADAANAAVSADLVGLSCN
ncbi:MAG: IPT/TIG domain-containing protein, partial [Methylobacter sp.]